MHEAALVDVDDLGDGQRAVQQRQRRQLGLEPVLAAGVVLDAEHLAALERDLVDRVREPAVDAARRS